MFLKKCKKNPENIPSYSSDVASKLRVMIHERIAFHWRLVSFFSQFQTISSEMHSKVMKDLEEILSDIEWNLAERLFNPTRCKTLKVRRKKLENEWRKLWAKGKLLFVSAGIWNTLTFHCFLHRLSYQNSFQRLTAALLCHIFSHVLFFFSVFIFFLV